MFMQVERAKRDALFASKAVRRRDGRIAAWAASGMSAERQAKQLKLWDDTGAGANASDDLSEGSDYRPWSKKQSLVVRCSPGATAYLTHRLGHAPTVFDGEWTPTYENFAEPNKWHLSTQCLVKQREFGFYNNPKCSYCHAGTRPVRVQWVLLLCWLSPPCSFVFSCSVLGCSLLDGQAHLCCIVETVVVLKGAALTVGPWRFMVTTSFCWFCSIGWLS